MQQFTKQLGPIVKLIREKFATSLIDDKFFLEKQVEQNFWRITLDLVIKVGP